MQKKQRVKVGARPEVGVQKLLLLVEALRKLLISSLSTVFKDGEFCQKRPQEQKPWAILTTKSAVKRDYKVFLNGLADPLSLEFLKL